MTEILATLAQLSMLVFVIGSMASMGLGLKMSQIITPLKNVKLVVWALVANFVLVPLLAIVITKIIPLDESVQIGLILLATAAGAPFLPKLAEVAKGSTAFSVGLMVLLMVVTIIYLPLVLLLLDGGVEVNPWDIARSLVVMMLIPLAVGMFVNARYEETAAKIQPTFGQASNIALLVLTVLGLVLNFEAMIDLVGTLGILAGIIFIALSLVVGFLLGMLGSSDGGIRSVMGLGTAQRNIAAALVVAGQNFDTRVLTYGVYQPGQDLQAPRPPSAGRHRGGFWCAPGRFGHPTDAEWPVRPGHYRYAGSLKAGGGESGCFSQAASSLAILGV